MLVQPYLSSYYDVTKLVMQQKQSSSTTKIDFTNIRNINDNLIKDEFKSDNEPYNKDNNRKF